MLVTLTLKSPGGHNYLSVKDFVVMCTNIGDMYKYPMEKKEIRGSIIAKSTKKSPRTSSLVQIKLFLSVLCDHLEYSEY